MMEHPSSEGGWQWHVVAKRGERKISGGEKIDGGGDVFSGSHTFELFGTISLSMRPRHSLNQKLSRSHRLAFVRWSGSLQTGGHPPKQL